MKCSNCGKTFKKATNYCPNCGNSLQNEEEITNEVLEEVVAEEEVTPTKQEVTPANSSKENKNNEGKSKKSNKMGLAGFIVSLCGLCALSFSTSIVGLVLSAIGLSKQENGTQKNRGFAIAGLVLGIIALVCVVVERLSKHFNWLFYSL